MSLLVVEGLNVRLRQGRRPGAELVENFSLRLEAGECAALVGESGSGKSVAALALMDLLPRERFETRAWRLEFQGQDLRALPARERARLRGRALAMVFQDPLSALHPLLPIGVQLDEVLVRHKPAPARERRALCVRALGEVGVPAPEERLSAYAHQLSGGLRQRVLLAMALLGEPRLLIADEPTTALDVSLQAQVLELLRELAQRRGLAVLFISHSLGAVAALAQQVHVMYAGSIVESAPAEAFFERQAHPYSSALLAAVPRVRGPRAARLQAIGGQPPEPGARPPGCSFAPRCSQAHERCRSEAPQLHTLGPGRASACFESARLLGAEAAL